ncbi:MAG: hypothetical protein JKY37_24435, partial [Nannocystaceae bacterium]|nr:hypothetical protein [Nannocystaceae bacterium]
EDDPDDDGPGTTTSNASEDDGPDTGSDECDPPCGPGDSCVAGVCFPTGGGTTGSPECHDVDGEYAQCLGVGNAIDTSDCGGNAPTCLTGGDPVIVGVCAITECVDECDCPAAPVTGTAVAACGDIAGGGNLCHIDCADGSTCPTGMECFAEIACVWPGEGADGVAFGDCLNEGASICGLEGICLSNDTDPPTVSVCTEECNVVGDCGVPPPGGTAPVSCQDVTGEGDDECVLDCGGGGSCPTGMTCFSASICMWD